MDDVKTFYRGCDVTCDKQDVTLPLRVQDCGVQDWILLPGCGIVTALDNECLVNIDKLGCAVAFADPGLVGVARGLFDSFAPG